MGLILFQALSRLKRGQELLEKAGDLLGHVVFKLDKWEDSLCADLPHEVGRVARISLD